jgi:hypothetical protein
LAKTNIPVSDDRRHLGPVIVLFDQGDALVIRSIEPPVKPTRWWEYAFPSAGARQAVALDRKLVTAIIYDSRHEQTSRTKEDQIPVSTPTPAK